ncbi:phosphatidylserine/phosphatidylglycerophosphate/cardiolipin synthase family protein [Marinimicrobium sp. ABcell2]|uniref:phospholipase D-like domain-containing protein n=1 Tax=Marinimicrobium sp. ABcell2 TaxID=3069751 RepID=UPI0027ADDDF1|nr:phospholipase D-like domain-containing protein [Marinimicrobium sp. ABcell2]MDQ2075846.1 phospholipase D-like domain-containing protein [Marinimicrobium sp. ABcell2]
MWLSKRSLLIYVALFLVAVVAANVILFNALPKPPRVEQPLSLAYTTADPPFERSLNALLMQPVVGGNQLEFLRDGEEIYPAMIDAINSAQHSITFETYEFWGENSARPLVEALARAAERGVQVHAVMDYIGSTQADQEKFERMDEAGVDWVRWREPRWYLLARFNHRTHRKLLVVDGQIGFIGGANIADAWLPVDGRTAYRDYHFRVEGPVVAQLQAAFAETWLDAVGVYLEGDAYFPELPAVGETSAQVVNSAPREGRHRIRKLFLYALAAAEEQVTASTAYFYPDADFLDAITAAAERGVKVRILVPGESIDQGYLRHASVNRWGPMLEAGVEIYEYQPSMFHAKLISIDDRWASIGSANLDNRSFRINDEANLNVYDSDFAIELRMVIEEELEQAKLYDVERWENRSWYRKVYGWVGMIIGAYL